MSQADYGDRVGRTPLHLAATQGSADVVELLLDAGAQPNCRYTVRPWSEKDNLFRCDHKTACPRETTAANDVHISKIPLILQKSLSYETQVYENAILTYVTR